jgi:hypothetical protein
VKEFPLSEDLLEVARHVVWFEPPEKALADPVRFLAYLMTYGTLEEVGVVRRYIDESAFAEVLDKAPPGIFDPQSWAYWNIMAGRYPVPTMPRRFADSDLVEIARSRVSEKGVPVDINDL